MRLVALVLVAAATARAAVSELPPIPVDLSTPVQQRLAFHGPNAMAVAWNTYKQLSAPTVHYGLSATALTQIAIAPSGTAASVTYKTSRTWANTVLISGLTPATTYYYKIDSTNSSIDTFVTARPAGDFTPFSVAAVVDMGVFGANGVTVDASKRSTIPSIDPSLEHTTIGALANAAGTYDFVLHPGDLAYADDWILGELSGVDPGTLLDAPQVYEGLIEQFFDQLSAVSRMKPYMVSPGNHEADCVEIPLYPCVAGQTNFTGYLNRFGNGFTPGASSSPLSINPPRSDERKITSSEATSKSSAARRKRATAASLANPPFWYSFDYGMTHFVMIDTETDLGKGLIGPEEKGGSQGLVNGPFGGVNQQINFLTADLASVDRTITPWVVVAGHRPWYTDGSVCDVCQTAFEPLFNKYGVDLALFGHIHNMQQIAPIANNVVDPAGLNNPTAPWYVINGAAGNIEGFSGLSSSPPKYITWANDNLYGFSKLIFHNKTSLEVQFLNSATGGLLQSATLYKAHTEQFVGA